MERRQKAPYWWPETQTVMQLFLSVAIVGMVWYILQQLLSGEALKIDPSVRDLIVFIFGIIFGNFKDVYGFTYGSSASDKSKGEAINRSIETKDKIIAAGVEASTAASTAATDALSAVTGNSPVTKVGAITPVVAVTWGLFDSDEQTAIEAASSDPKVSAIIAESKVGKLTPENMDYLVSSKLLTQARADEIKTK